MAAFAPILGDAPRILILGSMPSQISLSQGQYYANPQNVFWWIMSQLFELDLSSDYQARSQALVRSGLCVWDVLYDCERPGSLDSAIVKRSEIPNNFVGFFNSHPSISRVIFNGAKSEALFKRHCKNLIHDIQQTRPDFSWVRCPSTSPAHANMTKHDKLILWRDSLT